MLSIFLSYSRDTDKERAKVVRTKLEALGITVFQDIDMLATSDSSAVLDAQIGDAAGVFVLWTASSIKSKWVIAEAQKGLDRDVLVTAVFDNISPRNLRLPFNGLTTPNISDWIESGAKAAHPGWRSILGAIGSLVARPLIDLALTIEAGTPAAKLDFVKKYPDDLFSKTFAAEFKSAKKQEFSQRAIETKQKLEDRLEQAGQKLDALQIEFENKLDSAIKTGNFSSLDPRMIIDNTLAELSQNTEIGKGVLEIRLRETVKGLADANSRLEASKVEFEKLKAEKNAVETELSDKVALNSRLTNDLSLGRIRNLANYVLLLIAILVSASFAIYYLRYTKSQDQITALTGKFNDAKKALGESQTQLNQATDRAGQTGQTLARLNDLQAKLTSANDNVASLTRQRQDLSTQLSDAQSKLSDAQSKLKIAGDNGASLAQQKNEFSSQIGQAQTNLKAASEAVTSLTAQKNELSKQLDDARAKLSAFDTQKSSLTSWLNDVLATLKEDERRLKTQADQETSRRAAEESCNNLAGISGIQICREEQLGLPEPN